MVVVFGSLVESEAEPFHKPVAHLYVIPPFREFSSPRLLI